MSRTRNAFVAAAAAILAACGGGDGPRAPAAVWAWVGDWSGTLNAPPNNECPVPLNAVPLVVTLSIRGLPADPANVQVHVTGTAPPPLGSFDGVTWQNVTVNFSPTTLQLVSTQPGVAGEPDVMSASLQSDGTAFLNYIHTVPAGAGACTYFWPGVLRRSS